MSQSDPSTLPPHLTEILLRKWEKTLERICTVYPSPFIFTPSGAVSTAVVRLREAFAAALSEAFPTSLDLGLLREIRTETSVFARGKKVYVAKRSEIDGIREALIKERELNPTPMLTFHDLSAANYDALLQLCATRQFSEPILIEGPIPHVDPFPLGVSLVPQPDGTHLLF